MPAYVPTAVTGTITPTSNSNLVLINAVASNITITTSDSTDVVLTNSGTAIGQVAAISANGVSASFPVLHAPASISAQTYTIYCKGITGNGSETGGTMTLEEIMGANDNAPQSLIKAG